MSVLDDILADKRREVEDRARHASLADLKAQLADRANDTGGWHAPRGFASALRKTATAGASAVIAEVKKASPSKGIIREDFEPADIARSYEKGGATCLSVLTDEKYFKGHDSYLKLARESVALPVLRKDFIVDDYQVWETRALGADCLLLIVAALSAQQLSDLYGRAKELELDVLVEVHDEEEMHQAVNLGSELLGVNNRNLKTFETSLTTTERLLALAPDNALLVSESGIHTTADIGYLRNLGVHCYLIGEAFMRQPDPGAALRTLIA